MKDDTLYQIHISECIDRILSYIHGMDESAFRSSSLTQDAVLRNLQILSESTQRLSDEFKSRHKEIEWHKISGLRNLLVHDYLGIDINTVWVIINKELTTLKISVRN
ncbi:MAG: DUF86 domain-containing protein [Desulfobulbaceae bacterium]|nr:DUF86 domain-containing protein [Desulfobulbaceae bacterium]